MKKDIVKEAYDLSKESHKNQKSIDGKPYSEHLRNVYLKLKKISNDPIILASGLLHDIIEDTKYSKNDIERKFGKKIAFCVDGLTKIPGYSKNFNKTLNKLKKYIQKDRRILLIKLIDINENIRVLPFVKEDKKERVAVKTFRLLDVLEPLCKRPIEKELLYNKKRAIHKYFFNYNLEK